MYLGHVVEIGPTEGVVGRPMHPYTQALIAAVPVPDPAVADLSRPLPVRDAEAASTPEMIPGCKFHPRCPYADELSRSQVPVLEDLAPGHRVACFHARALMAGRLVPATTAETSDAATT